MQNTSSSALVTDDGKRVLFRLGGHLYELPQKKLRKLLGVPTGPLGVGITIDRDLFRFEFAGGSQSVEMSATRLQRRLSKQFAMKR